jgi:hypothetical protein
MCRYAAFLVFKDVSVMKLAIIFFSITFWIILNLNAFNPLRVSGNGSNPDLPSVPGGKKTTGKEILTLITNHPPFNPSQCERIIGDANGEASLSLFLDSQ